MSKTRKIALLAILVVTAFTHRAQSDQDTQAPFDKAETMIAMRDGTHLHTNIFAPKNQSGPLPIIFLRTPYGIPDTPRPLGGSYLKELADEGYIFAYRTSAGATVRREFVEPPPRDRGNGKSVDESSDTYDSIEWFVKNAQQQRSRRDVGNLS